MAAGIWFAKYTPPTLTLNPQSSILNPQPPTLNLNLILNLIPHPYFHIPSSRSFFGYSTA